METNFNFYDFVSYVIPGALSLVLLYWFLIDFCALELSIKVESIGESILFTVASYSFGHLIQALGNIVERGQAKKWGGWFSEQFLRDNNKYYTPEFKAELKVLAQRIFGLSLDTSPDKKVRKKRRQEFFNLCYSLIVQEKVALHTEIFNGLYGLYRGLIVVVLMGIFVSGIIALKNLILLLFSRPEFALAQGEFWSYGELQLIRSAVLLIFFVASIRLLESRFKRFGQHFVNSIYRNFYVLCKRKQWKKIAESSAAEES